MDELAAFTALLTTCVRTSAGGLCRRPEPHPFAADERRGAAGDGRVERQGLTAGPCGRYMAQAHRRHAGALAPIDKFTIPGVTPPRVAAPMPVCRTVCRRSERAALRADAKYGVDPSVLVWLNVFRTTFTCSDMTAHYEVKEVLWIP